MWKNIRGAINSGLLIYFCCGLWKTPDFLCLKLWKNDVMIFLPL